MAQIQETTISRLIVSTFAQDFQDCLELDVAVAGAGPSGIYAASLLARERARAMRAAAHDGFRPPETRPDKRARRLILALGDLDAL